jgi:hypothetical protein
MAEAYPAFLATLAYLAFLSQFSNLPVALSLYGYYLAVGTQSRALEESPPYPA